jgi:EAL domain-containing protein (putative c-di-GMP-specific phosphodiesterase class I)
MSANPQTATGVPSTSTRSLLEAEALAVHFQPVVSLRQQRVVLLEALCRCQDPATSCPLSPGELFSAAAREGTVAELDRACRRLAVETFAPLQAAHPELLLAVNIDSSLIAQGAAVSNHLRRATEAAGLEPRQVAVEMVESRVEDDDALQRFCDHYHGEGFLVALDDFGTARSSLDRVARLRPDILKLDRTLLRRIHLEPHRQEVLKAFVGLAHRVGAQAVAEGVEEEAEVLKALELGCDLFQGFFLSRPGPAAEALELPADRLRELRDRHKHSVIHGASTRRRYRATYESVVDSLVAQLQRAHDQLLDETLRRLIVHFEFVQCLYILDAEGRQVSDTVCQPGLLDQARSPMYAPAPAGTDQSLREYALAILSGSDRHTTEPYISQASGNLCVTLARRYRRQEAQTRILCCDIGVSQRG